MFFNKTKRGGKRKHGKSLTISSPAQKDLGDLEVVMHGHGDGWWHDGVYAPVGTLKALVTF
jgi:hypothetical protein